MFVNRILIFILGIASIVVIPIQLISTFVLGLAVTVTFGLLLLPISLIWALLFFPMVGLSWVGSKAPVLRNLIGIVFAPWAFMADLYVALMPSMGEVENRASKLMLCEAWPFTWEFYQFLSHRIYPYSNAHANAELLQVIDRISHKDPIKQRVLTRVTSGEELDSD